MNTRQVAAGIYLLCVLSSSLTIAEVLTPSSAAAQQLSTAAPTPATPDLLPSAAPADTGAASVAPATPAVANPDPSPATAPTSNAEATSTAASGSGPAVRLAAFNRVVSCVPFTILLTADAPDNTYSATTAYNPEVAAAVLLNVEENVLYVGFNESYEAKEAIKVNISLPASQLLGITSSGIGDVIVNPGFKTDYTIVSNQGAGKVLFRGITTNRLRVYLQGVGDVFAKGNIKEANITAQGTGRVTLSGVNKVVGDLQGVATVFVDPTTDTASIDLAFQGISKVYYTRGQCKAGSQMNIAVPFFNMDMGLSSCVKVQPAAFPRYKATWTCGTRVRGSAPCAASARAAQAAAAESGDVSVASATPNSNNQASVSVSGNSGGSAAADSSSTPGVTAHYIGQMEESAAGGADSAEARQAAAAGDVSIIQAGRRLHNTHQSNHPQGRKLDFMFDPIMPIPFVTSSSFSSAGSGDDQESAYASDHDGVFTWGTGDGSSATTSSSSSSSTDGDGQRVAVASIECVTPQEQLYIPAV